MSEFQICTEERPYRKGSGGRWKHPKARSISYADEYFGLSGGGNYEVYRCPICDLKFRITLPD